MNRLFYICLFIALSSQLAAQRDTSVIALFNRFSLTGYGAANYYDFNWQTDTAKRNAIDNERFILALGYNWSQKLHLNSEIEIEHGGTGVALEFDRFEEFGEFEFDVSKGGEVLLEEMNLEFLPQKGPSMKIGRIKVPFGMMFRSDEPTDYFTAINSETETQMLPENWTDNGILVAGKTGKRKRTDYYLSLTNGLDGSAFNSANWIKRGNQRRFEMANAENFALCLRLDFHISQDFLLGFSAYGSNSTTGNRPKPDLKTVTPLGIIESHLIYQRHRLQFRAMALYGALGNSEALSNQNRNLSNNLNVKRTPVGAAALGAFAELGYQLFQHNSQWVDGKFSSLQIYGRFDYYDTMYETQGLIFNNPRWERQTFSMGAVYKIIPEVQFKIQYSTRSVGAPAPTSLNGGTLENTFIAGFAFEF